MVEGLLLGGMLGDGSRATYPPCELVRSDGYGRSVLEALFELKRLEDWSGKEAGCEA